MHANIIFLDLLARIRYILTPLIWMLFISKPCRVATQNYIFLGLTNNREKVSFRNRENFLNLKTASHFWICSSELMGNRNNFHAHIMILPETNIPEGPEWEYKKIASYRCMWRRSTKSAWHNDSCCELLINSKTDPSYKSWKQHLLKRSLPPT